MEEQTGSPLISLHGQVIHGHETPNTFSPTKKSLKRRLSSPASSPSRKSPRTRNSPRRLAISRLPIRKPRFVLKELNLPPDESIFSSPPLLAASKITPEKLMQELKEKVAKRLHQREQQRKHLAVDEEISIPFTEMSILSPPNQTKMALKVESSSPTPAVDSPLSGKGKSVPGILQQPAEPKQTRISTRINSQITVDSPDLPHEDPLEIARQTLQNTKHNSGYRTCNLVYTKETVSKTRPDSPEHAFSQQTGLHRHMLKAPPQSSESENDEDGPKRRLRFNRVLHFLDKYELDGGDNEHIDDGNDLDGNVQASAIDESREIIPAKPCLVKGKENVTFAPLTDEKRQVVHVKKFVYSAAEAEGSKIRRFIGGAKRALPKNQ